MTVPGMESVSSRLREYFSTHHGYLPLAESKSSHSHSSQSSQSSHSSPRALFLTHRARETSLVVSKVFIALVAILALFGLGYLAGQTRDVNRFQPLEDSWPTLSSSDELLPNVTGSGSSTTPPKPDGIKIVALIFYGRREFVNVMDCYLKSNLAVNGGYLDSVKFLVHTEDEEDLFWLDELLATQPEYEQQSTPGSQGWGDYQSMWSHATDKDTIYIKIDDDVVYMHHEAIPRMVTTLLSRPDAYMVGANTINHALLTWMHFHTGATHAYAPEVYPSSHQIPSDWRTSVLPPWKGNPFDLLPLPSSISSDSDSHDDPLPNQRFLPLSESPNTLKSTLASSAHYEDFGPSMSSWRIAGQAHYSLLHNIEHNTLSKYAFSPTWNTRHQRYSINFIAIRGSTIAERPISDGDDEEQISVTIPAELNRPVLVDSRALVAHFAYHPQWALRETDVLERYRLLANEVVCGAGNQRGVLEVKRDE